MTPPRSHRWSGGQQPSCVQLDSGSQHWLSAGQIDLVSGHRHVHEATSKVVPDGQSVLTHWSLAAQYRVPAGGCWQLQVRLRSSSQSLSQGGAHCPLQQLDPAAQT